MKLTLTTCFVIAITARNVIASGPIKGCLQTHTVVPGDSCDGIAATFKLTPDQFYDMNPGLHHAGDHLCDNLDNDKKYCVCVDEPCVPEPVASSGVPPTSDDTSSSSTGTQPVSNDPAGAPPVIKNTVNADSNPGSSVMARSSPPLVAAAADTASTKNVSAASISSPFASLVLGIVAFSTLV